MRVEFCISKAKDSDNAWSLYLTVKDSLIAQVITTINGNKLPITVNKEKVMRRLPNLLRKLADEIESGLPTMYNLEKDVHWYIVDDSN